MISVITPLHAPGNAFIGEAYQSLVCQGLWQENAWEWVIVENNGGSVPSLIRQDPRVKVLQSDSKRIGELKRLASMAATFPYILELDADDILAPTAIFEAIRAFEHGADFVYSDNAQFRTDGEKLESYPYGEHYGWKHYTVPFRDSAVTAMRTPLVTAQNIRLVYWAPDHFRAWRKEVYLSLGGHDAAMTVGDDHDLIVRLFLAGVRFQHIPECLYFYRVHPENTVKTKNAEIQNATWGVYNRYIYRLAEKFAELNKLRKIDLCGGHNTPVGYTPVDKRLRGVDGITCDLDGRWKQISQSSVGVLRANDAIEHLRNPVHTMNEAYRVLAPGGFFMIDVPSTSGKGAFCDPTHVSFWNDLSFRYYCDPEFARYVPKFAGRFQVLRVMEWFPSPWHKTNNVPYVQAHLVALKQGYEPMGLAWRG